MRLKIGTVLFKIFRKILFIFGHNISLHKGKFNYPELTLDEENFVKKIYSDRLTMTSLESLLTLAVICKYIQKNNIVGDVIETGVWRGGSALVCAKFLRNNQKLYLFDTFSGMTEPNEFDYRIGEKNNHNTLAKWKKLSDGQTSSWVRASLSEVIDNFESQNLLSDQVLFIEGKIEETVEVYELPNELSLLRIDTDFYSSTKKALEVFWPKLTFGGVLILDDYAHWDGARRAADDFFGEEIKLMIPIAGGGGRIIVKN